MGCLFSQGVVGRIAEEALRARRRFEPALFGAACDHGPAPEVGLAGALHTVFEFGLPGKQKALAAAVP
jgi:hypothetical protein